MKQGRYKLIAAVCCGLLVPFVVVAARQTMASQESEKSELKEHENKLFERLSPLYQAWLSQDVVWIITPAERRAFLQMANDEDRDQFIEEFWTRRNPNPQSEENTFEEEHYRRILYANQHFGTFVPGWKTDRGKIYVAWGPPDEIESHPTGGVCSNASGAGKTFSTKLPWDTWHYRNLVGVGENVSLDFAYREGADKSLPMGDYLMMDPCSAPGSPMPPDPESVSVSLEAVAEAAIQPMRGGIQMAPPIKFKDLEALSSSRIVRDQIKIKYQTASVRATDFTGIVSIAIEIPEVQILPLQSSGMKLAQVNVFGRILNSDSGRVIETFEDIIISERGGQDGMLTTKMVERYEHDALLRAGTYRLNLAVKDVASGSVGIVSDDLVVPWYGGGRLETSSLILGDRTEREFEMKSGIPEVRPRLSGEVAGRGALDMFMQVYGLKVDEKSHANNAAIIYTLRTEGREVWREVATTEELGQRGEEVTIERALPVSSLSRGKYRLQIEIDDHAAGRIVSREGEFVVKGTPGAVN